MDERYVVPNGALTKRLRLDKGWSRSTLAEKVGCDLKTIWRVEKGKRVIPRILSEIATALGVKATDLLAEDKPSRPPANESESPVQVPTTGRALPAQRPPLDFKLDIESYFTNFTGRNWLMEELDEWLADDHRPVMVIVGEQGIGKSAIAAWLSQVRREVVGVHFCTKAKSLSLDPSELVKSLVAQLQKRSTALSEAIERRCPYNRHEKASDDFWEFIVEPLGEMAVRSEPQLLIIDSLDTAATHVGETILKLLVGLVEYMPPWLRIITTTKPVPAVLELIRKPSQEARYFRVCEIDAQQKDNRRDVAQYICDRLREPSMIKRVGDAAQQVQERLDQRAAGNFQCAKDLLNALKNGTLAADDLVPLGEGRIKVSKFLFERRFSNQEYHSTYEPLLQVFAAARETPPIPLLQEVGGEVAAVVSKRLRDLQECSFLIRKPEDLTVADWLINAEQAGAYFIEVHGGHERLADIGWSEFQKGVSEMSTYAVAHLPWHLAALERREDLLSLINFSELGLLSRWIDEGDHDAGLFYLEKIVTYLEEKKDSVAAAGFATQIALIYSRQGSYAKAEDRLEYALLHTSWRRGRTERAITLHELGSLSLYRAEYRQAAKAYRRALRLCAFETLLEKAIRARRSCQKRRIPLGSHNVYAMRDKEAAVKLVALEKEGAANLVALATVFLDTFRLKKTIRFARRAIRKADLGKDIQHLIAAVRLMASAYRRLGEYDKANSHIEMSLTASEAVGASLEKVRLLLLKGWVQLDLAILGRESPMAAAESFHSSLLEAKRIQNYYGIMEAKLSLGWRALDAHDTIEAADWLDQVGELLPPQPYLGPRAGYGLGLAVLKHQEGDLESALVRCDEVISLCRKYHIPNWEARAFVELGAIQWHTGDQAKAKATWRDALTVARKVSQAFKMLIQANIILSKSTRVKACANDHQTA